jgi:hypothetical protein
MRRESVQPTHSPRSNIAGSIDSARRTGIHLATSPSKDIARATPVSTSGSRSCLVHETRPVCRLPHKRCVRVREGGEVRETVTVDRGCFACMLGGVDKKRCSSSPPGGAPWTKLPNWRKRGPDRCSPSRRRHPTPGGHRKPLAQKWRDFLIVCLSILRQYG